MLTEKGVLDAGVRVTGEGEQTLGAALAPAAQVKVIELAYPFSAVIVPVNTAVYVGNAVNVAFATDIWKSGVTTRLNSHMPRPYVEARSNCWPPEANTASAVTATLGRNPARFVRGSDRVPIQSGVAVELANTPTSVPT